MDSGLSRERAAALDAADPLRRFRDRFAVPDPGVRYLDGNSLGRLPAGTPDRLRRLVEHEWGAGLVRSWAHWAGLPARVGDLIGADVLGASPGEVVVSDSTTVNLYKLTAAALDARPGRPVVVTAADEFPTDLYVLQGLAAARGLAVRRVPADLDTGCGTAALVAALDREVALVVLSLVGYRSGALADLAAVTAAAHDVGALMLWDLSHAAGAVPVGLAAAGADLAVGCTYKYLCGGPGAPAYLYVRTGLQSELRSPVWGWFGQRDQFGMDADYAPLPGVERFLAGSPSVLGLAAVEEGVALVAEAGVPALRAKGMALTAYLVELADGWLAPLGFRLASPRDPARRGAHVTLHHPAGWQVCQALLDRGVVPDFRTPDRLRLGPAPLSTSYTEVWEAMAVLREVAASEAYRRYPAERAAVT